MKNEGKFNTAMLDWLGGEQEEEECYEHFTSSHKWSEERELSR